MNMFFSVRRNSTVLCFLLFAWHISFSQTTIKGMLLKEADKAPIAYANIGILNTHVGTITNNDGSFELVIPPGHLADSVLFAALGFERKSIVVQKLITSSNITVLLKEQSVLLKNVTVQKKKLKPIHAFEVGNQFHDVGSLYVDSVAGGAAMALLIENPLAKFDKLTLPYFVTNARLRVAYNSLDMFRVRVRFMIVDPHTGLPGNDLFNESIVVTSKIRKGWVTFDLSKYIVRIHTASFYVVFEWILEYDERLELIENYQEFKRQFPKKVTTDTISVGDEKVVFTKFEGYRAGTSFGSSSSPELLSKLKCFYRNNSLGKWKRSSYALAATVTIANYE
jgi:hypothetical protein